MTYPTLSNNEAAFEPQNNNQTFSVKKPFLGTFLWILKKNALITGIAAAISLLLPVLQYISIV